MKKFEGYISLELKVLARVDAVDKVDAEDKLYELKIHDLLKSIVDVSTIDVCAITAVK